MSAYALIVEEGTALARQVRRGEVPAPDDDDLADKYLLADRLLSAGGLEWYELSNWARRPGRPVPPQRALLDRRATGGGSAREPTRTSAVRAGGTSGTRRRTPPAWLPG